MAKKSFILRIHQYDAVLTEKKSAKYEQEWGAIVLRTKWLRGIPDPVKLCFEVEAPNGRRVILESHRDRFGRAQRHGLRLESPTESVGEIGAKITGQVVSGNLGQGDYRATIYVRPQSKAGVAA